MTESIAELREIFTNLRRIEDVTVEKAVGAEAERALVGRHSILSGERALDLQARARERGWPAGERTPIDVGAKHARRRRLRFGRSFDETPADQLGVDPQRLTPPREVGGAA